VEVEQAIRYVEKNGDFDWEWEVGILLQAPFQVHWKAFHDEGKIGWVLTIMYTHELHDVRVPQSTQKDTLSTKFSLDGFLLKLFNSFCLTTTN